MVAPRRGERRTDSRGKHAGRPGARRASRTTLRAGRSLSAECARLLALVKERCPELLPPEPLTAGSVGPEVTVSSEELQPLLRAAADPERRGRVAWVAGDCELLVQTAELSARLGHGLVIVSMPVHCEETGAVRVDVPFVVGDERQPAGMLAATETRPRGPAPIVDLWGDALIAFAWRSLVAVACGIADRAGRDVDGAGLIPAALAAEAGVLRVLTQARHVFDRVRR
jgi:hypothetical protein